MPMFRQYSEEEMDTAVGRHPPAGTDDLLATQDGNQRMIGWLQVLGWIGPDRDGHSMWLMQCTRCDARARIVKPANDVGTGHGKACQLSTSSQITKHGIEAFRQYSRWSGMMDRCYNEENISYGNYGGRGITVCARWHDFVSYFHDIENLLPPRPVGHPHAYSIDRIDNDGDYSIGNVRWASRMEQARNRRDNVKWNGLTVAEAAGRMGFADSTIRMRLQHGWDLERAFTAPLGSRENDGKLPEYLTDRLLLGDDDKVKYDGLTLTEIATGNGWSINVIRERLRRGWDLERACTEPLAAMQYQKRAILFDGKTMEQAAKEKGWSAQTIRQRIRAGWSVERAFTEPLMQEPVRGAPRRKRQSVIFNGLTVAEAARKNGWSIGTIRGRLRRGWPVERAFTESLQESDTPRRGRRVQRSPEYDGKTMRQTERENGWSNGLIGRRIAAGWGVQRAFTEPQQEEARFDGLTIAEAAQKNGWSEFTIRSRLRNGWSIERAFTQPPRPKKHSEIPSGS